jgi:hypothetical protein
MRYLLSCLSVLILISSCSVQKRRYNKGFYVSRIHHKEAQRKTEEKTVKIVKPASVEKVETAPQVIVTGDRPGLFAAVSDLYDLQKNIRKTIFAKAGEDSCDVLLFKDGSEIRAKVLEISPNEVKYKRCDNLEGPSYVSRKADLFMIKYANGSREIMKAAEPEKPMPTYNYQSYKKKNKRVTHPSAPWALVFGILAMVVGYVGIILASEGLALGAAFIVINVALAIAAIIAAANAIRAIREAPDAYKGKGLAIPGLIFGIVVLSIYFIIGLIFLLIA